MNPACGHLEDRKALLHASQEPKPKPKPNQKPKVEGSWTELQMAIWEAHSPGFHVQLRAGCLETQCCTDLVALG